MTQFCLGILAGCLLSLFLSTVPAIFPLIAIILLVPLTWRRYRWLAGAVVYLLLWHWQLTALQYATSQLLQQQQLQQQLAAPLSVSGTIERIVSQQSEYSQFILRLDSGPAVGYRLRLSWQQAPALQTGQYWRLAISVKPLHSRLNPGLLDPHKHALVQHIIGSGYVIASQPAVLMAQPVSWREQLMQTIKDDIADYPAAHLLLALTVGERQFTSQQWHGIQHSGLGHLLTISGLHIGLIFGWVFWLSHWLGRCLPVYDGKYTRYSYWLSLLLALVAAIAYAWLAGFAIPTVRALLALGLVVLVKLQRRQMSYSQSWLLLVAIMLLWQPLWSLSSGFWLSVSAVAIIFVLLWQDSERPGKSRLWRFFRFHLYLSGLMSLVSASFFGGITPLTLVSNLLFVPYCSVLAIPLLLVTTLYSLLGLPAAEGLWQLTFWLFQPLAWYLEWCARQPLWWAWPQGSPLLIWLLLAMSVGWLLSRQHLVLVLLVCLLLPPVARMIQPAPWQLHLLDSGQAVWLVLQRKEQALLFGYSEQQAQSSIEHYLLPFLRQQGIVQLQYTLLPAIEPQQQSLQLLAPLSVNLYGDARYIQPCSQLSMTLADITLSFPAAALWPEQCIVQLEIAGWRLLLAPQLSKKQEQQWLASGLLPAVDLYLLAQHGRDTANSLDFLQQLAPAILLNSSGSGRHQYPVQAVQQRILLLQRPLLNTEVEGAISLTFYPDKLHISTARGQQWPNWL